MQPRVTIAIALLLLLIARSAFADWSPPADGKFTESQLAVYLVTQKELLEILSSAHAAQAQGGQVPDLSQEYQACLDKHHMSRLEFEWMQQRTGDAWSALAYLDGAGKANKDRLDAQEKQFDDQIAAEQQQLAAYQNAKTNGWRIVTPEDRDAIVKTATDEQHTAQAEVTRYQQDAQADETDAQQHDADAKAANDQAANPPSDVSAEDRAQYIQSKKTEAEAARQSASEARVEETDAKASQADAQGRADAAAQRAAHPEIPVTDDDKSKATADNDNAIAAARAAIASATEQKQKLAAQQADLEKTSGAMTRNVPPENIDLLRKYSAQYKQQLDDISAATRP